MNVMIILFFIHDTLHTIWVESLMNLLLMAMGHVVFFPEVCFYHWLWPPLALHSPCQLHKDYALSNTNNSHTCLIQQDITYGSAVAKMEFEIKCLTHKRDSWVSSIVFVSNMLEKIDPVLTGHSYTSCSAVTKYPINMFHHRQPASPSAPTQAISEM